VSEGVNLDSIMCREECKVNSVEKSQLWQCQSSRLTVLEKAKADNGIIYTEEFTVNRGSEKVNVDCIMWTEEFMANRLSERVNVKNVSCMEGLIANRVSECLQYYVHWRVNN
jgi:hypothetical protein